MRAQGEQTVIINPADADVRGIADGDEVQIHNDRGSLIGAAQISDKVRSGTVVAHFGYWTSQNKAGAANALTAARNGFAGAPGYYDAAVELALNETTI